MSRSMLVTRLRELERAGIVTSEPKQGGGGRRYLLTLAGRDLAGVLETMAGWGERWVEVGPEHTDPGFALWAWCAAQLNREALPAGRVVVAFTFVDQPPGNRRYWLLVENGDAHVCYAAPGGEPALYVEAKTQPFLDWHRGVLPWASALRTQGITILGDRTMAAELPTWNSLSQTGQSRPLAPEAPLRGRGHTCAGVKPFVRPSGRDRSSLERPSGTRFWRCADTRTKAVMDHARRWGPSTRVLSDPCLEGGVRRLPRHPRRTECRRPRTTRRERPPCWQERRERSSLGLAYRRRLDEGDLGGAIRCAFWVAFRLVNAGERTEANAWIARLQRLAAATSDGVQRFGAAPAARCSGPCQSPLSRSAKRSRDTGRQRRADPLQAQIGWASSSACSSLTSRAGL